MHKTLLRFIILVGISSFACVNASSIASITTLEPSVWVQQNSTKTKLSRNSLLKVGDNIITNETGRVEMKLWSSTILELNTNSDITILLEKNTGATTPYDRPRLYLEKGMACISYLSNTNTSDELKLNIGNTMFAVLQDQGDICVTRRDDLSSIKLRAGSVQVTHSVDPNLIVLSVIGTEFHIDDKGSFELLFPGTDGSPLLAQDPVKPKTVKVEAESIVTEITPPKIEPVIVEASTGKEEVVDVSVQSASTEKTAKAEPRQPTEENNSDASYRVYLFSTRSEDAAKKVNQKFLKAGHSTQIYTNESPSDLHYRIAVSGFKSEKTARDFARSIDGTLGVTGTWVGPQ